MTAVKRKYPRRCPYCNRPVPDYWWIQDANNIPRCPYCRGKLE